MVPDDKKEKKSNDTLDSENLKDFLKLRTEVLKIMASLPRLRIILLLLMFRKLSLSKLSKLLGRTKSTISHHLKKLSDLGIIITTTKDARGSIDAKVYELIPGFLEKFNLDFDELEKMDKLKRKEILHLAILNDKWQFEVIKSLYEQSVLYYDAIDDINIKSKLDSIEDFKNLHFKTPIQYDFWFLSEEGRKAYEKLTLEFKSKMKKIIEEEDKTKKLIERPYLILHSFFPLKEIAEYDSEKKQFTKFFKALES
ncbi:MAG: ArsR family transcriptional regulator [Promethearchaeota archaeon]|nr:MAG: ArsR family transcriptional regulator [Candidatus Lokiarchaeota archaeon]